jgi:branched-chain amino acid transport system permease protein
VVFRSEQSQLILLSLAFCVVGIVVLAIRRGSYGRRLAALRDSPVAASMLGMNLVTTKMTVFAISAGIAGMGGALFGALQATVSPADFGPIKSLFLYLTASFGGLTTVIGALFAGIFLAVMPEVVKHLPLDNAQNYLIGLGAISLATNPHGFGGTLSMARQAIVDRVGRRRPRERAAAPALAEAGAQ